MKCEKNVKNAEAAVFKALVYSNCDSIIFNRVKQGQDSVAKFLRGWVNIENAYKRQKPGQHKLLWGNIKI